MTEATMALWVFRYLVAGSGFALLWWLWNRRVLDDVAFFVVVPWIVFIWIIWPVATVFTVVDVIRETWQRWTADDEAKETRR